MNGENHDNPNPPNPDYTTAPAYEGAPLSPGAAPPATAPPPGPGLLHEHVVSQPAPQAPIVGVAVDGVCYGMRTGLDHAPIHSIPGLPSVACRALHITEKLVVATLDSGQQLELRGRISHLLRDPSVGAR